MNKQPVNNNYLAGFLTQTLKNIPSMLVREDVVGWDSPAHKQIEKIIERELRRAFDSERNFSGLSPR